MRESLIEKYLVQRVKALGGEVRKVKWLGRNNAPDRRVMLPNGCFWVELKATGQVATRAQQREHERMKTMGEQVFVIDSIEGIDGVLEK